MDCLFCRMVSGEIPITVVAENDGAIAFADIKPEAPTHVLVIPRKHYPDFGALSGDPATLAAVAGLATKVAEESGVAASGWRLVFNTGADAGQTVFHVHGHVLGGRSLEWPPG